MAQEIAFPHFLQFGVILTSSTLVLTVFRTEGPAEARAPNLRVEEDGDVLEGDSSLSCLIMSR